MEKEKAIEIFNKWMDCKDAYQADPSCDGNCFSCEYYASAEEEKEAMQMAISALKKQEQDRWHPCSEKMPAAPFGCFVTVMDTNPITQEEFENILPYFVGWDGEQWNDADGERTPFEVIAWKPLPDPYTEEEA